MKYCEYAPWCREKNVERQEQCSNGEPSPLKIAHDGSTLQV
jgi:hypothetical protein